MGAQNRPAAEHDVDIALARALLRAQHPDLADLELSQLAEGWDNVIFRAGSEYLIRLPRREMSAPLIDHEQRWLPTFADRLSVPIPVPVRVGRPGNGYPWSWSVTRWLPGEMLAVATDVDPARLADDLGAFLRALHVPAPLDAPVNPYRGVPLSERDERTRETIAQLAATIPVGAAEALWNESLAAPAFTGPPVWLHGDLHPANVLVDTGRLSAVIDFGDVCSGDPATDLAIPWMALPPAFHQRFRIAAGVVDDATWKRARAWALALSLAYLANSADAPVMAAIGRATLARALDTP